MNNINSLMENFIPTFNFIANIYSQELANYFIPYTILNDPLIVANFGLIKNPDPMKTPNPIIYDNFFSLKF